jgi:N-acetylglucosamine-6-phosphate deacetylase
MTNTAVVHGNILTPTGILQDGAIYIKNNRVDAVGKTGEVQLPENTNQLDAHGYLVAPGYIDAHIHGGNGYDFASGNLQEIQSILTWLAATGVTGVLPTIATAPLDQQIRAIQTLREASLSSEKGAAILGIHLEGPFINPQKRGAQPEKDIRQPSLDEMKQLVEAGAGLVKIVTLAPELPGAVEIIDDLINQQILVSVGHTQATYDEVTQAAQRGLNRATHLFNGMAPLHHRQPGVVGAVLNRDDIYAELILDGIHLHPATATLVLRAKGLDRTVLITDAIAATGAGDGTYFGFGGQKITVKNGSPLLDSGVLAGSTLTMDQAVRNAVRLLGLTFEQAIKLATQTAAESLGFETQTTKGVISPGKDADLIILDDNLNVLLTMVAGEIVVQDFTKTFVNGESSNEYV